MNPNIVDSRRCSFGGMTTVNQILGPEVGAVLLSNSRLKAFGVAHFADWTFWVTVLRSIF
jgi:hypothetical protein